MSSRVPLTQGIMTILSPIWTQGGFHRVRIDRRILELKDLERAVSVRIYADCLVHTLTL